MKVRPTQSRERVKGRSPLRGQGAAPLGFPPINTRKKPEKVTNSIARKGQGTKSLAGSRGSAPWFPPINTRKKPEKVTNSIARKGVQRVEDPLAGSRGSAPWFPPINTRKKPEKVTNSIARKGVQRVEDPLAGSRGSAPCASLIQTALCGQYAFNPIVDACRVSQRQSQRLIQRLQLVVVVFTVQYLQMQR